MSKVLDKLIFESGGGSGGTSNCLELCSREETRGFSEGGVSPHKSVVRAFSDLILKHIEWSGTPKQSYTLCLRGSECRLRRYD